MDCTLYKNEMWLNKDNFLLMSCKRLKSNFSNFLGVFIINLSLAGDDTPESQYKGAILQWNAKQEYNKGSVLGVAWWKEGFISLICWLIEVEKSWYVWYRTLIACKMAAIFQPGLFEALTSVPSSALGSAVFGSSVHLTAVSWLVVSLRRVFPVDWSFEQLWSLPSVQWRDQCKQLAS